MRFKIAYTIMNPLEDYCGNESSRCEIVCECERDRDNLFRTVLASSSTHFLLLSQACSALTKTVGRLCVASRP